MENSVVIALGTGLVAALASLLALVRVSVRPAPKLATVPARVRR